MSYLDLIIKLDTEGPDDEVEAIEMAEALVATGLVNSTGTYQRFVQSVLG